MAVADHTGEQATGASVVAAATSGLPSGPSDPNADVERKKRRREQQRASDIRRRRMDQARRAAAERGDPDPEGDGCRVCGKPTREEKPWCPACVVLHSPYARRVAAEWEAMNPEAKQTEDAGLEAEEATA